MAITNSNTRRTLIVLPETDESKQPNDRHAQIDMKVFNVIERDDVWTFFLLCAYDGFEMLVATNCFGWKSEWQLMAADGSTIGTKILFGWHLDGEDTFWWRKIPLDAGSKKRYTKWRSDHLVLLYSYAFSAWSLQWRFFVHDVTAVITHTDVKIQKRTSSL